MKELDQGYLLPDTEAGQVMTAEIRRQQRRREEEEIEEREEMELEAERLRRQQELALGSRSSRSTARTHAQRHSSTLPVRGSQAGGADRRVGPQRQPDLNAVQAAQISYSSYYVGWPFKFGPS